MSTIVTATLAIIFSSLSTADPLASLVAASVVPSLDAGRAESGCAPLQLDPVLNNVSHRVTAETADSLGFNPRSQDWPIAGELPLSPTGHGGILQFLWEAGYNTSTARLLSGYGDDSMGGSGDRNSKAVMMVILKAKASDIFSNCSYTKYGIAAAGSDTSQGTPSVPPKDFLVISVIVAGAPGVP